MRDTTISFEPDGPKAASLTSATPTRTRGETVTLSLGWERGTGYGHSYGSDYGTGFGLGEYENMANRLAFTDPTWTGLNQGVPWVAEDLPASAPVDSQVLKVVPGSAVHDIESFWGVLVGGTDNSHPPGSRRMDVELVFLADGSEFADRSALKDDLGDTSL